MSDLRDQQATAMESLRAPSGRDVIDRVKAERLGAQPRLRAVDTELDPAAEAEQLAEALAIADSKLEEERAARRKAEAAANEMAILVARVRNDLSEERSARYQAENTANEVAKLIATEHERTRAAEASLKKAEDQLRIAWAQVPMFEQSELAQETNSLRRRARRALKKS
jgi:hypothetical protein